MGYSCYRLTEYQFLEERETRFCVIMVLALLVFRYGTTTFLMSLGNLRIFEIHPKIFPRLVIIKINIYYTLNSVHIEIKTNQEYSI